MKIIIAVLLLGIVSISGTYLLGRLEQPLTQQYASLDLDRAIERTTYCANIKTYAETVVAERARGVPQALALKHRADTTFYWKNIMQPDVLDTATLIINTVYTTPVNDVYDFISQIWTACHRNMR